MMMMLMLGLLEPVRARIIIVWRLEKGPIGRKGEKKRKRRTKVCCVSILGLGRRPRAKKGGGLSIGNRIDPLR
uniref:Putative secreted protein n=1 Tax=Anopheles marajoara TaxID=58244 RepID=A0A2M4CDI4_9DIPT